MGVEYIRILCCSDEKLLGSESNKRKIREIRAFKPPKKSLFRHALRKYFEKNKNLLEDINPLNEDG